MAIKKIILANPRGFCAGVIRAIEIVERALELLPAGISAPEGIVLWVVDPLRSSPAVGVEGLAVENENVHFAIPKELVQLAAG